MNAQPAVVLSPALLTYWLMGNNGNDGELMWWKSQPPTVRGLASALFQAGLTADAPQARSVSRTELHAVSESDKDKGRDLLRLLNARIENSDPVPVPVRIQVRKDDR